MRPCWHIVVVVPARDEACSIRRCVRSLRRAAFAVRLHATTDIIVVADRCTDHTADRARRALGRAGIVVEAATGSVGGARSMGVQVGLHRAPGSRARTWIANTDADTVVPRTWLTTQLHFGLRYGVHAVAGVVRLDRGAEWTRAVQDSFSTTYRLGADGSHGHVHGANLGVRADVYAAVGGWSNLASGEDHDLWRRLNAEYIALHTTASFVRTSARRVGRAPAGFAAELAALEATAAGTT